jgi:hypothetical protein
MLVCLHFFNLSVEKDEVLNSVLRMQKWRTKRRFVVHQKPKLFAGSRYFSLNFFRDR